MEQSFQTKVGVSDVNETEISKKIGVKADDITVLNQPEIKWTLCVDMRQWGIKGFSISIPKQTIGLCISYYSEEEDDYIQTYVDVEIEDLDSNTDDLNLGVGVLSPLALDLKTKTLEF